MKKKYIVTALLAAGALLVCLTAVLTFLSASRADIIGGAGLPTLLLVFLRTCGGLYVMLACVGAALIIAALIVGVWKKRNVK